MVKAQTTREQAKIAKDTGQALFAFSCKYVGGTLTCDGPLPHDVARHLSRLVLLVTINKVTAEQLDKLCEESMKG